MAGTDRRILLCRLIIITIQQSVLIDMPEGLCDVTSGMLIILLGAGVGMSLNSEDITPSVDRYQPQHVTGRQHARVQLSSPSEHLQQTGSSDVPREDDIIKMASQVTVDVINSSVRVYAAEQSLSSDVSGSGLNRKQYSSARNQEPAVASSATSQPSSAAETSLATSETGEVEDKCSTGSQPANRSTDVDAVSGRHTKQETASSTGNDGPEAEALQDIARLQALTKQLRAAVAESRSADGLPVDVDDIGTRISSKDVEQKITTEDNDHMVVSNTFVVSLLCPPH